MKTLRLATFGAAVILAAALGLRMARQEPTPVAVIVPVPAPAPVLEHQTGPATPAMPEAPAESLPTAPAAQVASTSQVNASPPTVVELREAWAKAKTADEADHAAAALAQINTAESVHALMEGISHTSDWSQRASLSKNLRAVSDPETLAVLVPALLENYGRGSTILGEIVDAIARMAQPQTVEDLAALHWQASTQAGQGHKILRAVASIRNPAAARGLAKVAANAESPALAAAAEEALKVIRETAVSQATAQ